MRTQQQLVSLAEASRRLRLPPRAVSDGFYQGRLDDSHCQWISGRRAIPVSQLRRIAAALRHCSTIVVPSEV